MNTTFNNDDEESTLSLNTTLNFDLNTTSNNLNTSLNLNTTLNNEFSDKLNDSTLLSIFDTKPESNIEFIPIFNLRPY